MGIKKVIDPLNRIEGDLAVEITVGSGNIIEDARCFGFVYRGFENILIGKHPNDSIRLVQRICGVCPVEHGTASVLAIEAAANFSPPRNAQLVRDICQGANIAVSHLTHFYFMAGPDLVNESYKNNKFYPELMNRFEPLKSPHLKIILKEARIPLHSVVAIFGGRFPHPNHCIPGGVCCFPKIVELNHALTMLKSVRNTVEKEILNGVSIDDVLKVKSVNELMKMMKNNESFAKSDIGLFIQAAQEIGYHSFGEQTYNRFISYGFGNLSNGKKLWNSGVLENGKFKELSPKDIGEDTLKSYYKSESKIRLVSDGETNPVPNKKGAYTWIKSARYKGNPCEAGPLARQLVSADPLITDLVKNFGVNSFTRTIARVYEALELIPQLVKWVEEIDLTKPFYEPFPSSFSGSGFGLTEAARGALVHYVDIENGIIERYQVITPTVWNCGPEDSKGQKGTVEKALIGVKLKSKDSIIEAGHIVRSFDPCISCSIHAIGKEKSDIRIEHTV